MMFVSFLFVLLRFRMLSFLLRLRICYFFVVIFCFEFFFDKIQKNEGARSTSDDSSDDHDRHLSFSVKPLELLYKNGWMI